MAQTTCRRSSLAPACGSASEGKLDQQGHLTLNGVARLPKWASQAGGIGAIANTASLRGGKGHPLYCWIVAVDQVKVVAVAPGGPHDHK